MKDGGDRKAEREGGGGRVKGPREEKLVVG